MALDLQTDPVVEQDDPLEALKRLKAQQAAQGKPAEPDPLDALKALKSTAAHVPYSDKPKPAPPQSPLRFAAGKAGEALMDAIGIPPGLRGASIRAVTHPLETFVSVGQGVPGGKLAQTLITQGASHIPGMSSTGPMTYRDAFESVDDATKDQPLVSKIASKIPGAMVTGAALPAGAMATVGRQALTGAGLSAADRALSAKPEPLADRLSGTVKSAAIGAVAAPVISYAGDMVNALGHRFSAPKIGENMDARKLVRSETSGPLYDKFRALGDLAPPPTPSVTKTIPRVTETSPTPAPSLREAIHAFESRSAEAARRAGGTVDQQMARKALDRNIAMSEAGPITGARKVTPLIEEIAPETTQNPAAGKLLEAIKTPVVQRAIAAVKGESPELMKLADTDARVLADAYELVGDKAWRAANGFRLNSTRDFFKNAIDEASGGNFAPAVNTFRDASREMNAVTRGSMATKYAASPLGAPETKTDLSPSAFARWAPKANDAEQAAAVEGIGGRLKASPLTDKIHLPLHVNIPFRPSAAMREAPALLRQVGAGVNPRLRNVTIADILASLNPR